MTQDQLILPDTGAAPPSPPLSSFTLLTELEIMAIRKRIIEANGSMEDANVTLDEMRNVIYTCRMKANPMQENTEPKAKKSKSDTASTKREKLDGSSVDDFLA